MKQIKQTKTLQEFLSAFTFGENFSKGKSFSGTIKHSTMFSFWNDIAGEKISKYTKPVKIKYSKLYISAKSPVIIQEINLTKQKIINKANTYAQALGFTIKDLVVDYKNYKEDDKNEIPKDDKPEFYSNEALSEIEPDKNYQEEIRKNINKISFLNNEQKEKLINKILDVKKAQIKRMQKLDNK